MNGLFLNVKQREPEGIVLPVEVENLKRELSARLVEFIDPDRGGGHPIARVYDSAVIYSGSEIARAPDLIVGYAPGYRASWQTALGGVPVKTLEPNAQKWSGDHCIDAAAVPGVFFSSFPLPQPVAGITDVPALLLRLAPGKAQ